jgi:hypothetical protein
LILKIISTALLLWMCDIISEWPHLAICVGFLMKIKSQSIHICTYIHIMWVIEWNLILFHFFYMHHYNFMQCPYFIYCVWPKNIFFYILYMRGSFLLHYQSIAKFLSSCRQRKVIFTWPVCTHFDCMVFKCPLNYPF